MFKMIQTKDYTNIPKKNCTSNDIESKDIIASKQVFKHIRKNTLIISNEITYYKFRKQYTLKDIVETPCTLLYLNNSINKKLSVYF